MVAQDCYARMRGECDESCRDVKFKSQMVGIKERVTGNDSMTSVVATVIPGHRLTSVALHSEAVWLHRQNDRAEVGRVERNQPLESRLAEMVLTISVYREAEPHANTNSRSVA